MRADAEVELQNLQEEIEKEKEKAHQLSSSMSDNEMEAYMRKLKQREDEKRQVWSNFLAF